MYSQELLAKINKLSNKLHAAQSKREHCLENIQKDKDQFIELEKEKKICEEAQRGILLFLERGKQKSKEILEEIASVALAEVFGEGYELKIEYGEKYGASVAEIQVTMPTTKGEIITTGLTQRGGGLIDVVSMALCLCELNLITPTPQGPLIADEVFKYLNAERRRSLANVMRSVMNPDGCGAEGEGRQFIFVTHAREFVKFDNFADKVLNFGLEQVGNRTVIENVSHDYRAEK